MAAGAVPESDVAESVGGRRLDLMPAVAASKRASESPMTDPARAALVLDAPSSRASSVDTVGASGLSRADDPTTVLRLGAGVFDPLRGSAVAGQVEIRSGLSFLGIAPSIGLFANGDGGGFAYFALSVDVDVGPVRFTPTLGVGAYEEGDGEDLGGVLEFLSTGSITIPLGNGWRAGISYSHLSNSSIYEENPGAEIILGILEVPLFRGAR